MLLHSSVKCKTLFILPLYDFVINIPRAKIKIQIWQKYYQNRILKSNVFLKASLLFQTRNELWEPNHRGALTSNAAVTLVLRN